MAGPGVLGALGGRREQRKKQIPGGNDRKQGKSKARATATTGVLHYVQDDGVWRARRLDGGGMIAP